MTAMTPGWVGAAQLGLRAAYIVMTVFPSV